MRGSEFRLSGHRRSNIGRAGLDSVLGLADKLSTPLCILKYSSPLSFKSQDTVIEGVRAKRRPPTIKDHTSKGRENNQNHKSRLRGPLDVLVRCRIFSSTNV